MMLSREVSDPPDCLSFPGFARAASMKSRMVLKGESARTANTAGSSIRRATGVRSRTATLASALVSGVAIQTLVKSPMVWVSPLFSDR